MKRNVIKSRKSKMGIAKLYKKITSTAFIILIGLAFVLLIISYCYINGNTSKEYHKFISDSVRNIAQNFMDAIDNTTDLCISIYNSVEGTQIRLQEGNEKVFNSFYVDIIRSFRDVPFVQSVCVFSKSNEVVLSINNDSIGKIYLAENNELLKEKLNASKGPIFSELWTADNRYFSKDQFDLLSVYYRMSSPDTEHYKGTVVANIDITALSQHLFSSVKNENIVYYVLNHNGDILSSSDTRCAGENWSDKEWVKNIINGQKNEPLFQKLRDDGTSYEFCSVPASPYYYVVAQSVYFDRIVQVSNIYLPIAIVLCGLMIIGMVLFGIVNFKLFTPLNDVFNHIRTLMVLENKELMMDEVKMLDFYHDLLMNRVETLQENEIKNQIIKGLLKKQDVDELLIENGYLYPGLMHRLIVVCFDFENEKNIQLKEYEDYRKNLEMKCAEKFSIFGKCTCFVMGFRRLLILLEEKETINELDGALEDIFYQISVEEGFRIVSYMSDPILCGDNSGNCIREYKKADSCLRTAFFLDKKMPVTIIRETPQFVNLDKSFERAKECAENCDWSGLKECVHDMLYSMEGQRWEFCRTILLQLLLAVERLPRNGENEGLLGKKTLENIDALENQEEFWNILKNTFDNASEYLSKNDKAKVIPIMERAMDYISAHYSENDLNLNSLASSLRISAAYLGKLFKEFSGEGFNEFLTRTRLEHARELLLLEEKISVASVGEAVGYSNSSYFTAIFKKVYGVTPSTYRRMHNEEDFSGK